MRNCELQLASLYRLHDINYDELTFYTRLQTQRNEFRSCSWEKRFRQFLLGVSSLHYYCK